MRRFVTLPNLITTGNLAAGFLALALVAHSRLLPAVGLVVLAAALDSLDGRVAREKLEENEFGTTLDSLSDLVSFGAVPALALYVSASGGIPALLIALLYLVCGAWRLARFSTLRDAGVFLGLPIPPAGVAAMLAVLAAPPPVALGVTGVLAVLMVSSLPFPKLDSVLRPK
ncbi:CDP-diacylglycerol--serine O-phosphatidyltransferase [Rubrobacter taiwanensis]|jgi:CDP-diacylglycerol--serine O-phosphatidyltransferase|uniref:CDP-diacylglycerol--serine O-phosphatidyltransferase n=1 Tax=Rubrobacter taiwanensis TaxID=185139 RepID=A0A4R1BGH2_9ACTN|nr:CDP-diacylglycerol--serine O-phosphatidyltransferase [Rubrobacter taiwanensis]TCJ16178.1 CDP-diacylglycerol--serine O-phosphatidyltransferase [Rubrobacter taiwanensis]